MKIYAVTAICLMLILTFTCQALRGYFDGQTDTCLVSEVKHESTGDECQHGEDETEKSIPNYLVLPAPVIPASSFHLHDGYRLHAVNSDILSPPPRS